MRAVTARATFKYCTDPTFPPMEYTTTSGKIIGFDVDMATKLAATWGGTAVASKTAFPGLIAALHAKKCDAVISGIFITPDRTKQAPASAYMESHRVLIVKAGNPKKIHSPNGLKGLVVAVQTGTKYEEYLKALKTKIGFTLQGYPGDNDAVAQVLLGRADAVLTQDTSFAFQAKAHPGKIAVGFTFGAPDHFGIYYRKADAATLGAQIHDGIARAQGARHAEDARVEVQDSGRGRQVGKVEDARARELRRASLLAALSSGPYWRGALTALELTAVALTTALVIGFFVALGCAERAPLGSFGRLDLQLALPRDADAAAALLRLVCAAARLERLRADWFTPFMAAWITLSLNEAAYISEIIRAGLMSVDPGQELAGRALGMSRRRSCAASSCRRRSASRSRRSATSSSRCSS